MRPVMPSHWPRARRGIVLVLALVAGHGAVLHFGVPRETLPAAVLAGVAALLVLSHVGVAGVVRAWVRRRSRREPP